MSSKDDLGDNGQVHYQSNTQALEFQKNGGPIAYENHDVKPKGFFRRFALQLFVANFSLLQFFQMTAGVYWIGVVRTIEKRFGLSSTQTNFVMSVNDMVHICIVIFVGYFGRKGHKPRIIGTTAIFLVIGSLLMASPYFIYGEEIPVILLRNESSVSDKAEVQYCDISENSTNSCNGNDIDGTYSISTKVWYIFMVASAFNGLGGVAMQVLGMSYIDENADKSKSGLYIGIASSMFALGPICGISLAAIATGVPENLQPTDKQPTDPTWIGAWWLGYLVCAIILLIGLLPMFCYPQYIIPPSERSTKAKKNYNPDETLLEQVKEFPKSAMKLLTNKSYLCILLTAVFGCYVITGVFINTPRYIETNFRQPAFKANIGAALPGISGVIGGFLGGALVTKFKFTPSQNAKFIVFSVLVMCCGLAVNMFVTCEQVRPAGMWDSSHKSLNPDMPCNLNCSCTATKNTYHPLCASDGLTYFSPCHAGCTSAPQDKNGTMEYSDCSCFATHADDGQCEQPCNSTFLTFALVFFVMSFLSSLGRVPGTLVQFRIVGDEDGSFALGITSFMVNLCAFIPGPIIFGLLIDSTCILWQEECDQRGACLLYDTTRFRYFIFGLSLIFELMTLLMAILLVLSMRNKLFQAKEEETTRVVGYSLNADEIDSQKELIQEKVTGV